MTERLISAPLRVDFGGGWLDVPAFAVPGTFITNCAISPLVTRDSWPYERCGGLGGSAAYALLSGRDAIAEELKKVGWQDPAVILQTGLCVWRSGPEPVLEAQFNPDFLEGLMAIEWTGQAHDTAALREKPRSLQAIASAGLMAYNAARSRSVHDLAQALHMSYAAQLAEGMKKIKRGLDLGVKYLGSGWGGYALHLFNDRTLRDAFVKSSVNAKAVEPYQRSVQSSVLLWGGDNTKEKIAEEILPGLST